MERLAVRLARRLALQELYVKVPDPPCGDGARPHVPARACKGKQREDMGQGGHAHVVAKVEAAIVRVGVRADPEAATVRGAVLHGKHDRVQADVLLAVHGDARGIAGRLAPDRGEDLDARRREQPGALLARLRCAAVGRVERDGGIEPKRERLHEVGGLAGVTCDVAEVKLAPAPAQDLPKGGAGVVRGSTDGAREVVSRADGDDGERRPLA